MVSKNTKHNVSGVKVKLKEIITKQTSIMAEFDKIIYSCNQKGLIEYKKFAEILEVFNNTSEPHVTLKKMPHIMIRLYLHGSLEITEREFESFHRQSLERQQEIAFILYIIEEKTQTQCAKLLNFGDKYSRTEGALTDRFRQIYNPHLPSKGKMGLLKRKYDVTDKNRLTLHPRWDILKLEWDYTTNLKPPEEYSYGSHDLVN
ncbi:MAG: hypothetical protein ACFFCQ_06390 [Promethearchaeota archaeon]